MNNGQFKPGKSGNPKGRPRGARDQTAEQFRAMVKQFVADNWESLQAKFDAMDDKDQALFLERLLKHLIPAPQPEIMMLSDEDFERLVQRIRQDFITHEYETN